MIICIVISSENRHEGWLSMRNDAEAENIVMIWRNRTTTKRTGEMDIGCLKISFIFVS